MPNPPEPELTRRTLMAAAPALGALDVSGGGPDVRAAVQRYADAWTGGDLAKIVACYHDHFTLHYFGANALSGDHVGKPAALATLAEFSRRTDRRLLGVDAVLAGPERGALIAREMLGQGELTFEARRVLVYAVKDGLLAECWIYDEDQRRIDAVVGG